MERLRVTKYFSFDSAHFLPGYEGKCARMHGHTWQVMLTVEGVVDPMDGMVVDFTVLKKIVEPWIELLDHRVLNEVMGLEVPTAENIVLWFRDKWGREVRPATLRRIKVWESRDSFAEWINEP